MLSTIFQASKHSLYIIENNQRPPLSFSHPFLGGPYFLYLLIFNILLISGSYTKVLILPIDINLDQSPINGLVVPALNFLWWGSNHWIAQRSVIKRSQKPRLNISHHRLMITERIKTVPVVLFGKPCKENWQIHIQIIKAYRFSWIVTQRQWTLINTKQNIAKRGYNHQQTQTKTKKRK